MIILFNIFYIEKWLKQGQKVRVQAHSVSKWQKQGEIKVCVNLWAGGLQTAKRLKTRQKALHRRVQASWCAEKASQTSKRGILELGTIWLP